MFKEIGAFASLMKNLPKIKDELGKMQERRGQITAEGDSGAGMVTVKANGLSEILSVKITDEAMKDKELLEDLIASAVNQALRKVNQAVAEETSKMATNLGLPAGMGLPGLE